jgi:hypothetical protein
MKYKVIKWYSLQATTKATKILDCIVSEGVFGSGVCTRSKTGREVENFVWCHRSFWSSLYTAGKYSVSMRVIMKLFLKQGCELQSTNEAPSRCKQSALPFLHTCLWLLFPIWVETSRIWKEGPHLEVDSTNRRH